MAPFPRATRREAMTRLGHVVGWIAPRWTPIRLVPRVGTFGMVTDPSTMKLVHL